MSAQDILKMIETVSPDDTAKLDEIDARVHQYLTYPKSNPEILVYQGSSDCNWDQVDALKNNPRIPIWKEYARHARKVTRSRDALKAIRPEGYYTWVNQSHVDLTFYGELFSRKARDLSDNLMTPNLPTEELAELHAIIQAIEYERNNK